MTPDRPATSNRLACRIVVSASDDKASMAPLIRQYEVAGGSSGDEKMCKAAIEDIQKTIKSGRRININDAMMLYGMYAYHVASLANRPESSHADCNNNNNNNDEPHDVESAIADGMRTLLTHEQVMIGVPEMTGRVNVAIFDDTGGLKIAEMSVCNPISHANGSIMAGPQ